MQGKYSSSGARQREIARRALTLAGDKWLCIRLGVGRLGSGAGPWDLHGFTLVLLSCPRKVINDNCERGCEGKLMDRSRV